MVDVHVNDRGCYTQLSIINESTALNIAARFFEQHFSNVFPEEVTREDEFFVVKVSIGMANKEVRYVKIDEQTGRIISYT